MDADEEVVGARGGDRVQRVPEVSILVVKILEFWWRGFFIFGGKYLWSMDYLVKSDARSYVTVPPSTENESPHPP